MSDNSENKRKLIARLNQIYNRESGDVDNDIDDAVEALLEYVDDPLVDQLYQRIIE